MLLSVQCRLSYDVEHLTPAWFFPLSAHTDGQRILSETLDASSDIHLKEGRDLLHNRSLYAVLPPGYFEISYQAYVQISPPAPLTLAPDPSFLHASRYCCPHQVGLLLKDILHGDESEWQAADRIRGWVRQSLFYRPGSSSSRTRAVDTLISGEGVCRDFAHVAISLCRAAGLPARYVSVYAYRLDPADFHALFEVFADGQWHLMDATGLADVGQVVRIGVGRDAGDIPVAEFSEPVTCCGLNVEVGLISAHEGTASPEWAGIESA